MDIELLLAKYIVSAQAEGLSQSHIEHVTGAVRKFTDFMGGIEDAFEEACQEWGIRLFVLPPRSPKLNGHVERAQRTHTEEFYEIYDGDLETTSLNRALQEWERVYNHIRPHQALGYLTPYQYLLQCRQGKEEVSLII